MNSMESTPIEQLWYTWSDVGLSSIHAGFRIRAASPGLTEIYSERVKSMDRYMRYILPPGTNQSSITPEVAPIGLAFVRTDWDEYILVHKNYSGRDGVGRPGNFFVHVLALGKQYFSAGDAIWLWDAELWKTNDQSLDRRSTTLGSLPPLDDNPRFQPQYAQVRDALAFTIEAFLTRKERTPIYLAAPAHQAAQIAAVIAGLNDCLPRQFLEDLTFSTYEPDITKASTEIVGTSWIASLGQNAETVMPTQWYRSHLAFNCATGERSHLHSHPQIHPNQLATDFAAYAAECLVTNDMQQLEDLRENAEQLKTLSIELFLQRYNDEIANADNINESDIERILSNPDLCLDQLNNIRFRKKVIDCTLSNPQWADAKLVLLLSRLSDQAERIGGTSVGPGMSVAAPVPEQQVALLPAAQKSSRRKNVSTQTKKSRLSLTDALAEQAKRAIPEIVTIMRQAAKVQREGTNTSGESNLGRSQIIALVKVMESCLTARDPNGIWQALLAEILASPSTTAYLNSQWDIRSWLLLIWNKGLPVNDTVNIQVQPLLNVPWSRFGKFLKSNLAGRHPQWLVFATERMLQTSSPTLEIAQDLSQDYPQEVSTLLTQFVQEGYQVLAATLLSRLVEHGYKIRSSLDTLVEQLLTRLNNDGRFLSQAKGLVATLTQAGYRGTNTYQSQLEILLGKLLMAQPVDGNNLLDLLVASGYPRKRALLDLLLPTCRNEADIQHSIIRIYRTSEEQNEFFQRDGAAFLRQDGTPQQYHLQSMLSLYRKLLHDLPQSGKLERLFILLEASGDPASILSLLENSALTDNEQIQLLEQFGGHYLSNAQKAPELAQCLLGWFNRLVKAPYGSGATLLFHLLDPRIDSHILEHLLKMASLSPQESQYLFREYGHKAEYAPFLRQSPTSLALFGHLAQMANTYEGTLQGQQLSKEKMDVLFAWLNPSVPLSDIHTFEHILHAATLRSDEQILFLDRYGESYLSPITHHFPQFIDTYIGNLRADDLDSLNAKPFFQTLSKQYPQLPRLSDNTRKYLKHWLIVSNYLTAPVIEQETLRHLASALFELRIPLDTFFTQKLAYAFVFYISTADDLTTAMNSLQSVPHVRDDMLQFLYRIAEQAAIYHQQYQPDSLLPYLQFALTWNEPEAMNRKHFTLSFLDDLFLFVNVTDISVWRRLHAAIHSLRLPDSAKQLWKFYLQYLGLWEKVTAIGKESASHSLPGWLSPGRGRRSQDQHSSIESLYQDSSRIPIEQNTAHRAQPRVEPAYPYQEQRAIDMGGSQDINRLPSQDPSKRGTNFSLDDGRRDKKNT